MTNDKIIQDKFRQAVILLRKNARKPNKDGMLELTQKEGEALLKFLAPKYL